MKFYIFLKKLLAQFVDDYQKYFAKTFGYAILWTILCFAIGQLLAAYSDYDPNTTIQPLSILSYFSLNFSLNTTYSFVDLFKVIFIFFVSIFSIKLLKKSSFKAILYLTATLIICALLDFSFFKIVGLIRPFIRNNYLFVWSYSILALLRLYVPFILFALAIQLNIAKLQFSFKTLLFLFISIWLFYEVSYELLRFLRDNVFALILVPFKTKIYSYVMESLLGLPLVAAMFIGYYCAMTAPFNILRERNN